MAIQTPRFLVPAGKKGVSAAGLLVWAAGAVQVARHIAETPYDEEKASLVGLAWPVLYAGSPDQAFLILEVFPGVGPKNAGGWATPPTPGFKKKPGPDFRRHFNRVFPRLTVKPGGPLASNV